MPRNRTFWFLLSLASAGCLIACFLFMYDVYVHVEERRFPVGKDTVEIYAYGRYQIVNSSGVFALDDYMKPAPLLSDLMDWCQVGRYLVAVDREGRYLVVDLKTTTHQLFEDISAA